MNISRGKKEGGAQKLILYAPEGFGKSTFASKFKNPLFIDTEDSTKQLDVARFDDTKDWQSILNAAQYVVDHPDCCSNLVLDTIDWAEQACINELNAKHGTENILTMDYGKGSLFVVAEFQKLINILDKIIAKNISVIVTAHATMRKQELPEEIGAYDHWEMKLQSKQVKALVKEWADIMLFGNYKTMVIEDQKTKSKKAQGNKRVLYTEHHPCWDAKNRHGLKPEIPFDYKEIAWIFEGVKPKDQKPQAKTEESKPQDTASMTAEKLDDITAKRRAETMALNIPDKLKELMIKYDVVEADIQFQVAKKNLYHPDTKIEEYDPEFVQKALIDQWDKMLKRINEEMAELPFK